MTDLLALLNRFENAAGVYERSDSKSDRDELHASRRAILEAFEAQIVSKKYAQRCCDEAEARLSALVEREAELVKALREARSCFQLLIGEGVHRDALAGGIMASIDEALHPKPKSAE